MSTPDEAGATPDGLPVAPGIVLPWRELEVRAITGGGPGGQHVNRSATRIVLRWNARTTGALSDEQRARVLQKLASRLDADGALRIVAGEQRSQQQNRRAAFDRLAALVARALVVRPPRRATRPTRASVERRLAAKKRRGAAKRERRVRPED